MKYFEYDQEGIEYLKSKDSKLKAIIEFVGERKEPLNPDIFSALTYHIIGQQISARVQDVIYDRLKEKVGEITPTTIKELGEENLRSLGMSYRKAQTILRIADLVLKGKLDLDRLKTLSDKQVLEELCKIKGIGPWTAEMILMFSLNRHDVFTFSDIALNRGLKMIYNLDNLTKEDFKYYKEKFSPYGTLACIYFWVVGENKVEGIEEFVKNL